MQINCLIGIIAKEIEKILNFLHHNIDSVYEMMCRDTQNSAGLRELTTVAKQLLSERGI